MRNLVDHHYYDQTHSEGNTHRLMHPEEAPARQTRRQKKLPRKSPRRKGGLSARAPGNWDGRFHVASSKDNRQVHLYFKEFFDKPNKRRQEHMFQLRSNVERLRADVRLPTHSKVWKPGLVGDEYGWDGNFIVMGSKNNRAVHQSYREYFDRPIQYDVRGYRYSVKPEVMKIYDSSPESIGKNHRSRFFQTVSEWKEKNFYDKPQQTHTLFPSFPENNA